MSTVLSKPSTSEALIQSGNKDKETAEKLVLLYHSGELSEKEQVEVELLLEQDEALMEFFETLGTQQDFFQVLKPKGKSTDANEATDLDSISSSVMAELKEASEQGAGEEKRVQAVRENRSPRVIFLKKISLVTLAAAAVVLALVFSGVFERPGEVVDPVAIEPSKGEGTETGEEPVDKAADRPPRYLEKMPVRAAIASITPGKSIRSSMPVFTGKSKKAEPGVSQAAFKKALKKWKVRRRGSSSISETKDLI